MKKLVFLIVAIVVLGLVASGCIPVVPPTEQSEPTSLTRGPDKTYYVATDGSDAYGDGTETWVDNDSSGGWTLGDTGPWLTISYAISQVFSDDTIIVKAGTYTEGIITIDKDLTIISATSKPIINPTTDTGTANAIGPTGRGWFQIHNGATVTFKNLVFDGTGNKIHTAVHYHGDSAGGTVENCDFMNIEYDKYNGRGINNYGQHVDVLDCTFTDIQRIGVFTFNPTADTLIKDCTYTGKGAGDWLDYAFEVGNDAAITVEGCTITECTASGSGWDSAGILVTSCYGPTPTATITGNDIHSNSEGVVVGYGDSDNSTVILTCNDIRNNDVGVYIRSDGTTVIGNYNNIYDNEDYGVEVNPVCTANYDFENNWWGHVTGPTYAGNPSGQGDAVSDNVDYDPWSFTPDPCEAKTLGFWKNHPDSVYAVINEIEAPVLGNTYEVNNVTDALEILNNAKAKNAYNMLAAQLLAAELNKLHLDRISIDSSCFVAPILVADGLLTGYSGVDSLTKPSKELKETVLDCKDVLDSVNNDGCFGACACEWD